MLLLAPWLELLFLSGQLIGGFVRIVLQGPILQPAHQSKARSAYTFFTELHTGRIFALQHQLNNEIKFPVGVEAQPCAQLAAGWGSGKELLITLEAHWPEANR